MIPLRPTSSHAPPPPVPTTAAAELERTCEALHLAALIQRMGTRDESALTDFHRIMADRFYSMALRMLGDRESAADALQDCMVCLWRDAPRYDPRRGDAFTWSAMILRGRCLDHLRRRRRRATGLARWEQTQSALTTDSPAGGLEDLFFRETLEHVRSALRQLEPGDRECLHAALFEPGTTTECADALGLTAGTLKVRIHRAMQRLRNLLGTTSTLP